MMNIKDIGKVFIFVGIIYAVVLIVYVWSCIYKNR